MPIETAPPSLSGTDYTLPPPPKRRASALIYAHTGEGKTTMALRAAMAGGNGGRPAAFHDVDQRGFDAVEEARAAGLVVHYLSLDFPNNLSQLDTEAAKAAAQATWDRHLRNYKKAIDASHRGEVGYIIIDTVTELAQIGNIAITGRTDRLKDDYGRSDSIVKSELSRMLKMARKGSAHLILLAHSKEVWVDHAPSGRYTFRGPDQIEEAVDWSAHLRLRPPGAAIRGRRPEPVWEMELDKVGSNAPARGDVSSSEDWKAVGGAFVYGCLMNWPSSKPRDWR